MATRTQLRNLPALLLLFSLAALGGAVAGEGETPADEVRKELLGAEEQKGEPKAQAPAAMPAGDYEQSSYEVIKNAFKAPPGSGAATLLSGKELLDASLEEMSARTLVRNLTIRFQEQNFAAREANVQTAKGAFDPVVGLNVNLTINQTYNRSHTFLRNRFDGDLLASDFEQFEQFFNAGGQAPPPGRIVINGVDVTGLAGFETFPVQKRVGVDSASFRAKSMEWLIRATYDQTIPWGSSFSMSWDTIHTKSHIPPPSNDRPWASNFSLNLTVPVPFLKDWGPYAPADAAIKISKRARDQARFELDGAINANLQLVTNAYWNLVRTMQRLDVTIRTVKNLEQIRDQTKKLLDAGRATLFEVSQVNTELARVRTNEEQAWAEFLLASNELQTLLDFEKEIVLLPVRYSPRLAAAFEHEPAEAIVVAMNNNPDVQASQMTLEIARIGLKASENQAKPDLKLIAGVTWTQNNSPFGYRDMGSAWGQTFNPDSKNNFVGMTYSIPWGNKPADERLRQAHNAYLQAEKNALKVVNEVERRVTSALAALDASRQRVGLSQKNRDTAERVYKTILELWDEGRVPPLAANKSYPAFEVLQKNNDLLEARLALIEAQVFYKIAETELLAAEGVLPSRYSSEMNIRVRPADEIQPGEMPEESK